MVEIKTVRNEDLFRDIEGLLFDGSSIELRVKGHSMRPFMRSGRDVAVLAPVDPAGLCRGMVVLFRRPTGHVLHRIRRIKGDRLTIKGDGNYRITEIASRSDVAAYTAELKREGKMPVRYGSLSWQLLSAWSLSLKVLRTVYRDLRRVVGLEKRG